MILTQILSLLQLEIIEEGLQLKLEIKNIKEQFLSLLHNYDKYQTPASDAAVPAVPQLKGVSAARARVKALYEARKQRLLTRRSIGKEDADFKEPALPKPKRRRESSSNKENKENKENIRSSKVCSKLQGKSVPHKSHTNCACHPRSTAKFLTPIKEESNVLRCKKHSISPSLSDIEGDYVTLKAPNYENIDAVNPHRPHASPQMNEDTSIWVNSHDGLSHARDMTLELSSMHYTGSPTQLQRSRDSPVKYASSDYISELYTSPPTNNKSLKDLSHIGKVNSTMREQISGSNLNGSIFHSTLNYPLHSTLNYPLHSTISFPEDSNEPQSAGSEQGLSDTRTTTSEPSHVLLARQVEEAPSPQAFDDSWLDIRSLVKVEKKMSKSRRSSSSSSRSRSLYHTPKSQRIARPSLESPRTPTTQAVLCKEHGLHPTFGGPCIFQTDDSMTMSDSSEEDHRPRRRRRASLAGYTETDCDSSYLSECMDEGSNFNQGLSSAEEYTATYDARQGRMKMLKRQTGTIGLDIADAYRQPVGLSESDFLETTNFFEVTKKHLSLEATRSSLPDLSNLETSPSDDDHDSTLKTTLLHSSGAEVKRPVTLERTMTNASDQRPPSTLTSTSTTTSTTSPSSNGAGAMPVPVNSPNVTDSGSSSKPTTDNYDYVEVPVCKDNVKLPPSRHPPRSASRKRPGSSKSAYSSTSRPARRCLRYQQHDGDSGFSTPGSLRQRTQQTERHALLTDQTSAVGRNLQRERKKQIVKKLKQFNNTFYSTGNLNIQTLGHF